MKFLLACFLLLSTAQAQWTRLTVPTAAGLRGLSVVNDKVIWASGTGGIAIRTVDGGKAWSVMQIPGAETLDFRGIHAFDANNAIIVSSGPAEKGQAKIFRTVDGGKSWSQVYQQETPGIFFDAVAFWDRKHGIVLSDPVAGQFALFTTNDGGSKWKQVPGSALPPALTKEGAFAASNSCLTVQGKSNVWFATGGATVARVFRSSDRGRTWSVSETPVHPANASSGIFSLAFADSKNGVAVGGDYQHPESSNLPNILETRDGGQTWQAAEGTNPAGVYLSSVALDQDKVFVAGIKGLWSGMIHFDQTRAGARKGGIWQQESTENINSVAANNGNVWAVGPNGMVLMRSK